MEKYQLHFIQPTANVDKTIQSCIGTSDVLQYEWTIHFWNDQQQIWMNSNLGEQGWKPQIPRAIQPGPEAPFTCIHTWFDHGKLLFSSHVWWNQRVLCPMLGSTIYAAGFVGQSSVKRVGQTVKPWLCAEKSQCWQSTKNPRASWILVCWSDPQLSWSNVPSVNQKSPVPSCTCRPCRTLCTKTSKLCRSRSRIFAGSRPPEGKRPGPMALRRLNGKWGFHRFHHGKTQQFFWGIGNTLWIWHSQG